MRLKKQGKAFLIVCDCESDDLSVSKSPKKGTLNHFDVICNDCGNKETMMLNERTEYINR